MDIVEKDKGNEKYYYLRHNYRKGKKVMSKEKYLGKEIPKDIDRIKSEFQKEINSKLYSQLEKIKENFQQEWKRLPQSARDRENEEIAIAFTYNTNAIEGSTITLEEAREIINDKISVNKPLRDVRETEAHARVFLEILKLKDKVTEELLLKWHNDIFSETKADIAGKYRDYLVKVGEYRAIDWQDIEKEMKKLIDFINNEKINPVELSAKSHYKFEKIHPFGDGNGRIGRLLMNYVLWINGYPMIIIEYKKRKSYYNALKRDENGFVKYFLRRYIAIHKRRLK